MLLTLQQWQLTPKNISDLIVQASSTDCDDGWRPWTIGMSWQYLHNYHKGVKLQIGEHERLVFCGICTTTDITRRGHMPINREKIVHTLAQNNIYNQSLPHEQYFDELPHYKFVISPEGNGIDCHRHYEALLAGCIPILERNPLTEEKYEGCPILWTTDYSEITPAYLSEKYTEMIHKTYDFSKLFLAGYDDETQQSIKYSGNYWINRIFHTDIQWYKV
jgi:hypothetical protein